MKGKRSGLLLGLFGILFLGIQFSVCAQVWNPNYSIGTVSGKYSFSYAQVPDALVEINPPAIPNTGLAYQWESSLTADFSVITPISTTSSYSFTAPLSQTTYYRRKTMYPSNWTFVYSNIIKVSVVSVNWEDRNYVREHDVLTGGLTDWKAVDQLAIGQKLQTTTYLDGLGRNVEQVSRETATPSLTNGLWGDIVQFSSYDVMGREAVKYLPYTTTTESGKYKTAPATEQAQYYSTIYNETAAYSTINFDKSPLNRLKNVKQPGSAWAGGLGSSVDYDLNAADDQVRILTVDYVQGNPPVNGSVVFTGLKLYPEKTLYKHTYTDENNKAVVEYTNMAGELILKKVQLDAVPTAAHAGWICTYYVYDDFGLLRYQLQPEAVKYLDANGWSFAGTGGAQVLSELCFQYDYDAKGRTIWKKAPGAKPLRMLYDSRDRVVLMQDGNQALKSPAEWTTNLYDVLDRPTITTLYATSKTSTQLQTDIDNAITATSYGDPVTSADLNNTSVCTIVKYQYYDTYSFTGVKLFDAVFNNTSAYSNSDPNVLPIATSKRTLSFPTGSRTRVLGTTTFLNATEYYDNRGNHIQTLEDNLKTGKDVTTYQYHFDGRLLSTYSKHTTTGTGYTDFGILTKNIFDKIGRVTSIQKQYGGNALKTIASYDYDDVGRLKTKHLDPGYTGSGKNELEALSYSFNIHNNITGINKDYALKTPGKYDKWGNFFGLYLGYDNQDGVFSAPNLNGQVTGVLWNTQGDDAQRKYDYSYDNAGRLINGAFKEKKTTADTWSNTTMDFSVSGRNGKIEYDLNGNLLFMSHKGVLPGSTAPVLIDDLQYVYTNATSLYGNKLLKVTDNSPLGSNNGRFGDFKDGTNGTADDYVYDDNGNLVIDLNKNVKELTGVGTSGIVYNFLDKPEQIKVVGKGLIKIVYDANGNKLQRSYTPEGTSNTVTTTYINEYVYQGDVLQSINFEEGRIRVMQAVSQNNGYDALTLDGNMDLPGGKRGAYDYYIRDYQENVRMILTEEVHTGSNQCTMETARATSEEPIFGQTGAANEVVTTRFAVSQIPGQTTGGGWQNANIGSQVSRLSALSKKTGPNALLKVMAGDQLSAMSQYWYQNPVSNGSGSTLVSDVLSSLVQAITGSAATSVVTKEATTNISTQLNANTPFKDLVAPDASNTQGTNPKAYLTIIFFDERFNYVGEGSALQRVVQSPGNNASLVLTNVKAPKNGYAFVYLSNESSEPVYFDNFQVVHNRGRIIEENHYYSYGLKIAAISSKKLGDTNEGGLDNKNLYNDKELFDDGELNWYDYGFRNYDPQIGRFTQLDPLTDDYPELTPYQYASNDPITNIDIDGLEGGLSVLGKSSTLENITITSITRSASNASGVVRLTVDLSLIATRGAADAIKNANSFGLHDYFGGNHLDEYKNIEEKKAYLRGRISGDAIAIAQGGSEFNAGSGTAGAGLATGPGAVFITTGGVLVAVHGGAVGLTATSDAAWAIKQLYKLNISSGGTTGRNKASSDAPKNGETSSTAYGRDVAHPNYNPGKNYTINRQANLLKNGKIPDAIDRVNRIVRELKPNNPRAIAKGISQARAYAKQLQKQFGGKWKIAVDTYEVGADGKPIYNFGTSTFKY